MGKIIFWLIVFFVVLLVLRLVSVANSRGRKDAPRSGRKAQDAAMTRCVNCGVYLPSAEAIQGPRGPVCGDPQCLPRDASR
ncbi:MAG: PP0621 family protein [Rudaea sp.]